MEIEYEVILMYCVDGTRTIVLSKLTVMGIDYWGVINQITGKTFDAFSLEQGLDVFLTCCDKVIEKKEIQ